METKSGQQCILRKSIVLFRNGSDDCLERFVIGGNRISNLARRISNFEGERAGVEADLGE